MRILIVRLLSAAVRAIVFTLLGGLFALPLEQVREVARVQPLSQVPRAPRALLGAMSLRGRILAVVAPEMLLDRAVQPWPEEAPGDAARLLVLDSGESALALRVASVEAIHELTPLADGVAGQAPAERAAQLGRALGGGRARLPSGDVACVIDLAAMEKALQEAIGRSAPAASP